MQPRALKAGCRDPAIHAGRRNQRRPYSTQVRTKGTWQRVPPVRQSSIGHATNSLKGKLHGPNHTDQHMPRQAHHKCSPGRGIVNDGSAPCATILPRHPESQVGPRPCTLGCIPRCAAPRHCNPDITNALRRCRPATCKQPIQFIFATDQPTPPWARTTYGRRTTVWTRRDVR